VLLFLIFLCRRHASVPPPPLCNKPARVMHPSHSQRVCAPTLSAVVVPLVPSVGSGPLLSEGTLKIFVAFAVGGLLGGTGDAEDSLDTQASCAERHKS
jgi:hypothetical protein